MSSRLFRRDSSKTKNSSETSNFSNGNPRGNNNNNNDNKKDFSDRKAQLTPLEYRVTQDRETERPFSNKYNRHWEPGTYHCVVCEAELFQSSTKFESKSGWPAFSNVVDPKRVKLTADLSHIGANLLLLIAKPDLARTEVSCANCNAHLGHLFKDGPKPTGLRYCINSSSLHFVTSSDEDTAFSSSSAEESRSPNGNNINVDSSTSRFQEFPCNPENSCGLPSPNRPSNSSSGDSKSQTLPPMATLCLNNQQCQKRITPTSHNSKVISSSKPEENSSQREGSEDKTSRRPFSPVQPQKPNINLETKENPMFPKCTSYKPNNSNVNQDTKQLTPFSTSTPTLSSTGSSPFGVRGSSGRYPSSKGASLTAARIHFFQKLDTQQPPQPHPSTSTNNGSVSNSNSTCNSPSRSSFANRFVNSVSSGSLGLRRTGEISVSNDNQHQNGNVSVARIPTRRDSGPHGFSLLSETVSSAPNPLKETVL